MLQASASDATDQIHSWSPCSDVLPIVTNRNEPIVVHIDKIRQAVDSLFRDLATALSLLFPSQMGIPSELEWNSKDDINAPNSFVDQDDFLTMMSPIYTRFTTDMHSPSEPSHKIWSNNNFQPDKFSKWLQLGQRTLRTIFLILLLTGGGIPPKAFSIAALQYRTTSEKNNLYLQGVLCFVWPKEKSDSQSRSALSDSLFAYPPRLNWFIFIYLGIIRRFAVETMTEQGWPLGEMESKLFVSPGTANECGSPWKPITIDSALGDITGKIFGFQFKVFDLCQLMQAIYSQHFEKGREKMGIVEAIPNCLSNHSQPIAANWYGRSNSKEDEWVKPCIAYSKAWHCWLGLIPYDPIIFAYLGNPPVLQRHRNEAAANKTVSTWVKDKGAKSLEKSDLGGFVYSSLAKVSLDRCLLPV